MKFQAGDIVKLTLSDGRELIGEVTRYQRCIRPDDFSSYWAPHISWKKKSIIFIDDIYNEEHLELVERVQLTLFEEV